MYKGIELETQEGKKTFPFLATGTTAYRYKQCFHQDLMIALNNMEDTADDQADMTVGDKLAYIMNAQAEKKEMRGERLFYCFKTDNLCIWPSLPRRAVSSKRIKSDKNAFETGNDMLYSIDAVTSFFYKSDKTAIC